MPPTTSALHAFLVKRGVRWAAYAIATALVLALIWAMLRSRPMVVEMTTITTGPMQVTIDGQGQMRLHDKYIITAPVAAELERIELHEGDKVTAGQRLAVLRPLPLDARQRDEALARLDAAQALARAAQLQIQRAAADQQLAASELARVEKLVAQGFMSTQSVEQARNAMSVSQAELRSAKARETAALAEVNSARAALPAAPGKTDRRALELRANVSGQILRIHEKSARTVAAGTPLLTLGDPARFEVVVDVLSTDAVKIQPGADMQLEQWGGGRTLRARVRTIEPGAFTKVSALGIEEQRVNIIGDPLDPLEGLGDGYQVEARIVIWSTLKTTIAPASSLFRVGEAWHVFVVEAGRARERAVEIGQRNAREVQILSGLKAGDSLVRFPGNTLTDGLRVQAHSN